MTPSPLVPSPKKTQEPPRSTTPAKSPEKGKSPEKSSDSDKSKNDNNLIKKLEQKIVAVETKNEKKSEPEAPKASQGEMVEDKEETKRKQEAANKKAEEETRRNKKAWEESENRRKEEVKQKNKADKAEYDAALAENEKNERENEQNNRKAEERYKKDQESYETERKEHEESVAKYQEEIAKFNKENKAVSDENKKIAEANLAEFGKHGDLMELKWLAERANGSKLTAVDSAVTNNIYGVTNARDQIDESLNRISGMDKDGAVKELQEKAKALNKDFLIGVKYENIAFSGMTPEQSEARVRTGQPGKLGQNPDWKTLQVPRPMFAREKKGKTPQPSPPKDFTRKPPTRENVKQLPVKKMEPYKEQYSFTPSAAPAPVVAPTVAPSMIFVPKAAEAPAFAAAPAAKAAAAPAAKAAAAPAAALAGAGAGGADFSKLGLSKKEIEKLMKTVKTA